MEQGGAPELAQLVSNYDNVYMPYVYHIYILYVSIHNIYIYIHTYVYIYIQLYTIYM
jgi:hypothetical protein